MKTPPAIFPQTSGALAATQKCRPSKGRALLQHLLSGTDSTTRLRRLPPPPAWFSRIVVWVIAFIALFAATARAVTPAATTAQIATLEERVVAEIIAESESSSAQRNTWLPTLGSDGLWPLTDINYNDTSRHPWSPSEHLNRLRRLAVTCRKAKTSNPALFTQTREPVIRALKGWLDRDPTSLNWWWNQINATTTLGKVLVLMKSELTDANGFNSTYRNKALDYLARAWNGYGTGDPAEGPNALTGANLVWVSIPTLHRGIFADNLPDINRAAEGVFRAITTTKDGEGVLKDGSFHQHGPFLYNGGYAPAFFRDSLSAAIFFRNLDTLALDEPTLARLEQQALDGDRWMLRGNWFDNSTRGREVARHDVGPIGSAHATALDRLVSLNGSRPGARNTELQAMRTRILNSTAAPFTGTKVFPRSDYLVQARAAAWLSVRAASSRTVMTENTVNDENITGAYQGDGAMFLRTKGDEYFSILPLSDPAKVPGTTTRQSSILPTNTYKEQGANAYSGGASLDQSVAYGFRYTRHSVTATKGWIVFPDATVFFGSDVGVTSTSITDPLATTINQTRLRGDVTLRLRDASSSTLLAKASTPYTYSTPPSWLHHDGFGYIFPSSLTTPVEIHPRTVTGRKWTDVSVNSSNKAEITTNNETLTLGFNHGANPSGGRTTYAAIIYPAATADAVHIFAAANPITILAQTATVLAARHSTAKITGALFRGAGATELRSGVGLASDGDAAVLVQETDTAVTIAIADPTQSRTTARLNLGLLLSGPGAIADSTTGTTTIDFSFPTSAEDRGSTVSATFTVFAPSTPATPPAAPSGLTASISAAKQIVLAWTDNSSNEPHFIVERSTDGATFSPIATLAPNSTGYTDHSVYSGVSYTYRIAAGPFVRSANTVALSFPGRDARARIEAESPDAWSGLFLGFQALKAIDNNDWARYDSVDFGAGVNAVSLQIGSGATATTNYVEVWLDARTTAEGGTQIANLNVLNTGGNSLFSNLTATLSQAASGIRDVYLFFKGGSGFADIDSFTFPPEVAAPAPPESFTVSSQPVLGWTLTGTNEDGVKIERSNDGVNFVEIATIINPTSSYIDSGVTKGTTADYRVRSYNRLGFSVYSNVVSVVIPAAVASTAPTQFSATPTAANQITLSWTAPAGGGQTAYNLDFRLSGGSAWTSLTNPAAAATSFVHTGLTGGSTYEYRLRATNSVGPSAYANTAATAASGALGTGTSLFGTTTPPAGSSNDSNYELGMRFRVTQRGQVTALRVYRPANGAASYPARLWRASDQTVLATTTITGGTPVGWKSANLATPVTLETGVTYLVTYSVDAGVSYQATSGGLSSTLTSGALTTAGAANSNGFIGVYVATKGAFPNQSFNNSNYWADVTFSPFLPVPAAPGTFTATAASASSIQLSWTAGDSTQTGYSLEVSADGQASWSSLNNPAGNATSYTHTGLSASVTRAYRLRATNGSGSSGALTASATTWTALEGWRVSQGLAQNGTGTAANTADPDGDGLVNLLEYALDLDPLAASATNMSTALNANGKLSLTFFRARPASELTYTVQASSDLVTWTDLITNPGSFDQNVTVTDAPPAGAPRRFMRLRVTSP
jgi:chondroitin AC lyase